MVLRDRVGVVNYNYINKIKALGARKLDAIRSYDVAKKIMTYILIMLT